jgi:hypothetical protein
MILFSNPSNFEGGMCFQFLMIFMWFGVFVYGKT